MKFMLIGVWVYTCIFSSGLCSRVEDLNQFNTLAACQSEMDAQKKLSTQHFKNQQFICVETVDGSKK